MLHDIGGVGDHSGDEDLTVRQFAVLPYLPLMGMPGVGRFDAVGTRVHLEDDIHDVLQGDISDVGPMPTAPTQVIAHAVFW